MVKHVCSSMMHHSCTQTQSYCFVQIVPIENIEGRKAAEEGDTCLRRTFSGVDLNRNWGTEWKQQVCSPCSPLLPACLCYLISQQDCVNQWRRPCYVMQSQHLHCHCCLDAVLLAAGAPQPGTDDIQFCESSLCCVSTCTNRLKGPVPLMSVSLSPYLEAAALSRMCNSPHIVARLCKTKLLCCHNGCHRGLVCYRHEWVHVTEVWHMHRPWMTKITGVLTPSASQSHAL